MRSDLSDAVEAEKAEATVGHTPTPWKAQQGTSYLDEQPCWMVPGVAHCGDGPCSEANARFIVKAVNAHDDLLAMLKDAERLAEHAADLCADIAAGEEVGDLRIDDRAEGLADFAMKCRAAIAKAEPGA